MNIFILDLDPKIAASYHCDQHIHKMILESAQMLSTAAHFNPLIDPSHLRYFYKPAYEKHPCTKWVGESLSNAAWVVQLCEALEEIRMGQGHTPHQSMSIVNAYKDCVLWNDEFPPPSSFVFAGPLHIRVFKNIPIVSRYQQYYIEKYHIWKESSLERVDRRGRMTYKDRPIPPFLSHLEFPNA